MITEDSRVRIPALVPHARQPDRGSGAGVADCAIHSEPGDTSGAVALPWRGRTANRAEV